MTLKRLSMLQGTLITLITENQGAEPHLDYLNVCPTLSQ